MPKLRATYEIPGLTIQREKAGGNILFRYVFQHDGQVILLGYAKSERKARDTAAKQLLMLNEHGEAAEKVAATKSGEGAGR